MTDQSNGSVMRDRFRVLIRYFDCLRLSCSFVRSRATTPASLVVTAVKGGALQPGDSNKATKEPGTISTRRKLGEFFAIKMPTLQAVMTIADESAFSDHSRRQVC